MLLVSPRLAVRESILRLFKKAQPLSKPPVRLKQTTPPPKPKRQTKQYLAEVYEYAKNQAKWEAAKEWCADRGYEFKVLTEIELDIT